MSEPPSGSGRLGRDGEHVRSLALSAVGIMMVVSVVIGAGVGMFIDGRLGTTPWLTAVGVVFGAAAGFREVWRIVRVSEGPAAVEHRPPHDPEIKNL